MFHVIDNISHVENIKIGLFYENRCSHVESIPNADTMSKRKPIILARLKTKTLINKSYYLHFRLRRLCIKLNCHLKILILSFVNVAGVK